MYKIDTKLILKTLYFCIAVLLAIYVINIISDLIIQIDLINNLYESNIPEDIETGNYFLVFSILGIIIVTLTILMLAITFIKIKFINILSLSFKVLLLFVCIAFVICAYCIDITDSSSFLIFSIAFTFERILSIFFNMIFLMFIMITVDLSSIVKREFLTIPKSRISQLEEKIKNLQEKLNIKNSEELGEKSNERN